MSDDLDFGATLRGFVPGQVTFGRYRLEKILGRGGMGVVWLAHDQDLERAVALKFLPEVVAGDKQAIQDLKRETRRSLELTHPNIIRIYDFVQDATTAAISMEYVAGDTLASLKVDQPEGHFEAATIRKWTEQLCTALTYAHGKAKVVHRDLKPANLMIDAEGDLKIADFGIAASVSDSVSRVSVQAGSSGTPVYMSPQQMMGEKPAITDDVYALGATLYDLLTSRPPFYSGNVMMQVMNKAPVAMTARREELEVRGDAIPTAWEDGVLACLAKEASDRPASAAAVWERLNKEDLAPPALSPPSASVEKPAPASPPPPPSAPPPRADEAVAPKAPAAPKQPRSLTPVWIGLAVLLVAGAGAGWWYGIEQPRRAEAARLAEIRAQEEAARQAEVARLAALRIPIHVSSNPAAATVWLDGRQVGVTPWQASPGVSLGEHELELRRQGYVTLRDVLSVSEDSSVWSYDLDRAQGSVRWNVAAGGADVEFWLSRSGPRGPSNYTADIAGWVEDGDIELPTGKYWGLLRNADVRAAGGDYTKPIVFEVTEGEAVAVTETLKGYPITLSANVEDEVTFTLWDNDPKYQESEDALVTDGTLPFAGKLAPAAYRLVYRRSETDLAWERNFTVTDAGQTLELDVKGPTLVIRPQGGPAEVWDGEGNLRGTGSRIVLDDLSREEGLTFEVRREGFRPVEKSFYFQKNQGSAVEITWDPTLEAAPAYQISTDFRTGPSKVRVTYRQSGKTTSRTVVNGKVTEQDPVPTTASGGREYEIERFGSEGNIQEVISPREVESQGVEVYQPDTAVRFVLRGGEWDPSFIRGGFANAGMNIKAVESPTFPSMWLTSATLPEKVQAAGDTWNVPMSEAAVMLPFLKTDRPAGTIEGRVSKINLTGAKPTAELVYTYDVSGPLRSFSTEINNMKMVGRLQGTTTLQLDLERHFVSSVVVDSTTTVQTRIGNISTTSEMAGTMELAVEPLAWSTTSTTPTAEHEVEEAPVPLVRVQPTYPESARRLGLEGKVLVSVLVAKDGTVAEAEIENSSGVNSLDAAALAALKKYRFRPGQQNGEPVMARVTLAVVFKLE